MRLIDADAVMNRMEFVCMGIMAGEDPYNAPLKVLDSAPTIKTKEVKYFDEEEKVWKIGSVIVDE